MAIGDFEGFSKSLQRLGGVVAERPEDEALIREASAGLTALKRVSRPSLAALVRDHPEWIPVLGLCVRISGEQLKGILRQRFETQSLRRIAADHAKELVDGLDDDFGLIAEVRSQRRREWSFGDVLMERGASRARAAGSIGRGRRVEDLVENVVTSLSLPYAMRTRFVGRGQQDGPADLAIPSGDTDALIVCAIKGFDSTGSKLTDAAQEIRRMADIRLPTQYVFAVVDGLGWLRRQSDLRRIHDLAHGRQIDGLFSISQLGSFKSALEEAARRHGLLD